MSTAVKTRLFINYESTGSIYFKTIRKHMYLFTSLITVSFKFIYMYTVLAVS